MADRIDAAALRAYQELTGAEGFPEWFARISPLAELGGMRIGSRPARRGIAAPRAWTTCARSRGCSPGLRPG